MPILDFLRCRPAAVQGPGRRSVLVAGASLATTWPLKCLSAESGTAARTAIALSDPELNRAAQRAELCSPSNAPGTGLRGEYFARDFAQGKVLLVRTDSTVDFDNGFEWPAQAGERPKSARWTGWVKPSIAGSYRFHANQEAASLVVARQPMLGQGASATASIALAAGRYYPMTLQIDHVAAMKGRLRLEWTAPHGARYLIPRALMFLPSERVPSKP